MNTHPSTPGRISRVSFFEFRISNFEFGWVGGGPLTFSPSHLDPGRAGKALDLRLSTFDSPTLDFRPGRAGQKLTPTPNRTARGVW